MALSKEVTVPLIVASAAFLQQVDATALATSIPAIAHDLGEAPVRLHLAITVYLLSVAAFVPLSGWATDRFGARLVFRSAVAVFTIASVFCGLATNFEALIIPRIVQGMAGAMMVPVGRLIMVRTVSKEQLLSAYALMTMPSLVGPIIGPALGGLISTYLSWRWIFWVNLPIGVLGIVLATIFIDDVSMDATRRFDLVGVVLTGIGAPAVLFGIDGAATASVDLLLAGGAMFIGVALLCLYVVHARRIDHPIIDVTLLTIPTFRASVVGGSLFRMGAGAMPFLLPLLFQQGFGYTPFESGVITAVSGIGALGMRTLSTRILRALGFRNVLLWNALAGAASVGACALIQPGLPLAIIVGMLFFGGVFRSLELVTLNTVAFAGLDQKQMSHATSFTTMAQRLSQSMGVALGAFALHIARGPDGTISAQTFPAAFLLIGALSALAVVPLMRLHPDAGVELSGRPSRGE